MFSCKLSSSGEEESDAMAEWKSNKICVTFFCSENSLHTNFNWLRVWRDSSHFLYSQPGKRKYTPYKLSRIDPSNITIKSTSLEILTRLCTYQILNYHRHIIYKYHARVLCLIYSIRISLLVLFIFVA